MTEGNVLNGLSARSDLVANLQLDRSNRLTDSESPYPDAELLWYSPLSRTTSKSIQTSSLST